MSRRSEPAKITIGGNFTPNSKMREVIKHHFAILNENEEFHDTTQFICIGEKDGYKAQIRMDRDDCFCSIYFQGERVLQKKLGNYGLYHRYSGTVSESVTRLLDEQISKNSRPKS